MSNQIYSAHQPDHARNLIESLTDENGDTIVKIDPENNLVHLTYLCQKGGKESANYLQTARAKNFIEAVSDDLGFTRSQIVQW